jgi:histidinol-phosphate aminotransferase
MSNTFWSNIIKNYEPYTPGEQPGDKKYIKLNANENPYPPSPKVLEALKEAVGNDLRLYPDSECLSLRKTIAQYYSLSGENIFVGNGSDELLGFSFIAFFKKDKPILFPEVSYSFYPIYANIFEVDYKEVPLDNGFGIIAKDYCQDNGGIIFPNPNAPTGRILSLKDVTEIIESNQGNVVIVDEAYIDFGGETAVPLISRYPNLLVLRTFSKSRSLAGMRLGYAMGNKDLIDGLNRVKHSFNSYTLDRLALVAGMEAIKDEDYFIKTREKVKSTREFVSKELIDLGFNVIPSCANFIFISHKSKSALEMQKYLKDEGLLVRHFNKKGIENFLRVTIGTDEEMGEFVGRIKSFMINP